MPTKQKAKTKAERDGAGTAERAIRSVRDAADNVTGRMQRLRDADTRDKEIKVLRDDVVKQARLARDRVEPVVRRRVEPVYRDRVEPVIRQRVEPVYRKRVEPVVRERVEPAVRRRFEPVYRERVEPVVERVKQRL